MGEYLINRIHAIQQELEELKGALVRQMEGSKRRTQLRGLWEGVLVSDDDLRDAQQAIFRDAYSLDK
jgi:hypothetical protein